MRVLRCGPALAVALAGTLALGGFTGEPGFDSIGAGGGRLAPNGAQTDLLTREYDDQLNYVMATIIASAEIGPDGRIFYTRPVGDPRFLEPNSGRYWQVSGEGQEDFRSRSLWDRRLQLSGRKATTEPLYYNSAQFPDEPLRVAERTIRLPGSDVQWQFVVARVRHGERLAAPSPVSCRPSPRCRNEPPGGGG